MSPQSHITKIPSALGTLSMAWYDALLKRLYLPGNTPETELPHITLADLPERLAHLAAILQRYAAGEPVTLADHACAPLHGTAFQDAVRRIVRAIPRGVTRTYGEVAKDAGSPKAARAVGQCMATNPLPLIIPCHRVVATHGLGGYGGGLDLKQRLLDMEHSG